MIQTKNKKNKKASLMVKRLLFTHQLLYILQSYDQLEDNIDIFIEIFQLEAN